jgi:DNA-directed RNA polymerase specialized sigma24 family protein
MSGEPGGPGDAFPMTPWSLVARAATDGTEGAAATMREALGTLLQRYLPALRAHLILHRRIAPDLADDLLQSFVSRKVLEQRLIARSDRTRGRFRSFLLKALDHYVIDQLRQQKSRGGAPSQLDEMQELDLADDDAEAQPSQAFDRAWAKEVVAEAVRRMRAECQRTSRPDVWGVFEHRVLAPSLHGAEPLPYEQLVKTYALDSPAQASNVLMTAKRTFARMLRGVIAESAEDDAEIEQDLRDLKQILASGAG